MLLCGEHARIILYTPVERFSPDGGFVGMAKFSGSGHMPATEKDGVFKCSHFLSLAVVECPPRTRVCTTRVDAKSFLPARHSRLAIKISSTRRFSRKYRCPCNSRVSRCSSCRDYIVSELLKY